MDRTQWTDKNRSREAVSQMKCTLRLEGIGEGAASLNGMMLSLNKVPSMSNISSSADVSVLSPFSSETLRVRVSIAWEMRDFSRAANMLEASSPEMLAATVDAVLSPLLEPFSVELSSSLDSADDTAPPSKVSGANGVRGSSVGESYTPKS